MQTAAASVLEAVLERFTYVNDDTLDTLRRADGGEEALPTPRRSAPSQLSEEVPAYERHQQSSQDPPVRPMPSA